MPDPIRATLLIDPAALPVSGSPDISRLADELRSLIGELRERLNADSRIAVGEREAAAMLGLSGRMLQELRGRNEGPPYVRVGTRIVYGTETLRGWLAEREVRSRIA